MNLNDISSFDYIIALIVLIFLIRGLWIGFMRQLAVSFALVGSYWVTGHYIGQLIPSVQQFIEQPKMIFLVSFAVLFIVSALIFILIGNVLHKVMEVSLLGWFNRFTGGLLGIAKGAVLSVLLYMILSSFLPPSHHLLRKSLIKPYLGRAAEICRQFIEDPQVREDLKPLKPEVKKDEKKTETLPAPPKTLPETSPATETQSNISDTLERIE